jgi:hypothetical protein
MRCLVRMLVEIRFVSICFKQQSKYFPCGYVPAIQCMGQGLSLKSEQHNP